MDGMIYVAFDLNYRYYVYKIVYIYHRNEHLIRKSQGKLIVHNNY